MNFQQLETFHWVARLLSFSQAASKVNASQSTVSMRLIELEKELGIKLLDRTRRSVKLTPKGRDLQRYADEIVLLISEIRQFVGDTQKISGNLRIGAAELVALTWLPSLMKAIKIQYPLVDIDLQIGVGGSMLEQLRAGDLDLVLMPTNDEPLAGMRTMALGSVRFGFVAGQELGIPKHAQTPQALLRWPVITHGPTSVLHGILERWFETGTAQLHRTVTSSSMETAARLAGAGLGVTFLPLDYYAPQIADGRLRLVKSRPGLAPVAFNAVFPRGRTQPLIEAIAKLAVQNSSFERAVKVPTKPSERSKRNRPPA